MTLRRSIAESEAAKAVNERIAVHKSKHSESPEVFLSTPRSIVKTIVRFAGTHFGGPGRITCLIGPAGRGKSQVVEAAVSSFLNSHVDTLGIEIVPPDGERPLLWIDTERTADEILDGFDRIKRRVVLENNPELVAEDRFTRVRCHSFIGYADPTEKVMELERLITNLNPFLVLLDGGADLVRDVNNSDECAPVIGKFISLANTHQFSMITTVHPNPGDGNDHKPRGHYGSELVRKAESVLLLKRAPDDRDVRILTTDFVHGKNRSASDSLEHYFSWSEVDRMFKTCSYTSHQRPSKSDDQAAAFSAVLPNGLDLRHGELLDKLIKEGYCGSRPTATRWIRQAAEKGILVNVNERYRYQ